MAKQYRGADRVFIQVGDYVRTADASPVGLVQGFFSLKGGMILVSIDWVNGTDCPAWINEISKVEPEELI